MDTLVLQDRIYLTTAKIWDYERYQNVLIEYSGSGIRRFVVNHCKVITPIELEPSDLYTDVCLAISEHQHTVTAEIECEIEYNYGWEMRQSLNK